MDIRENKEAGSRELRPRRLSAKKINISHFLDTLKNSSYLIWFLKSRKGNDMKAKNALEQRINFYQNYFIFFC